MEAPVPIEDQITAGLLMWFADGFGLVESESLFFAPSTTKAIQAAQQKFKAAGKTLTWPIAYLRDSGVSRDVQSPGYNAKSLMRRGILVNTDDAQREFVRKLHLARVDQTYDVVFLVDNYFRARRFTSSWMTLGLENRVNFTIDYYGVPVDIACRLAPSIDIPEKETSVDEQINVFEISTQIVVEGYVTAQHRDSDSQIPLVRNISVAAGPVQSVDDLSKSKVLNAALANIRR